ncbi:hypothetical protein [Chryseobacterium sp. T1]
MKKLALFLIAFSIFSCKKAEETQSSKVDSTKIVDSINLVRQKINDSIMAKDRYNNLVGTHVLTHDMIKGQGKIDFAKAGKDEYSIKGSLQNGNNYIKIDGVGQMISKNNLKFQGTIKQSIHDYENGKLDVRSGKKIFFTKDGCKTFKLHESVNSFGFSDQIYIKF